MDLEPFGGVERARECLSRRFGISWNRFRIEEHLNALTIERSFRSEKGAPCLKGLNLDYNYGNGGVDVSALI